MKNIKKSLAVLLLTALIIIGAGCSQTGNQKEKISKNMPSTKEANSARASNPEKNISKNITMNFS